MSSCSCVYLHLQCGGAVLGIFIWVGQSKAKQILGRPTEVVCVGIMGMTRAIWVGQARVQVGHTGLIARTASAQLSFYYAPDAFLSTSLLAPSAAFCFSPSWHPWLAVAAWGPLIPRSKTPSIYIFTQIYVHCVSKNNTALACYNFDKPQTIVIIFGRDVVKKASSQMVLYFYFPTSPNQCFCNTWGNSQKLRLHLNAECCFANSHIHTITCSQLNHSSLAQVCTKQNLGREYSMLPSLTTHSSFTKSVMMSIAIKKWELFLIVPEVKS